MRYNKYAISQGITERRMPNDKNSEKQQKKYTYLTKAIQLPDGSRKYLRAKTQKELDEKVMQAQILVNSGVDICSEETFGHFAQMWYDMYKKPYLRENSLIAIKNTMNSHILPAIGSYTGTLHLCTFRQSWRTWLPKVILSSLKC